MMEPNSEDTDNMPPNGSNEGEVPTAKADNNEQPQLPPQETTTPSSSLRSAESSMDIEQPLPSVAEIRGKSDNEEASSRVPMRRSTLYALMALPFLFVLLIVIMVVSITTKESHNSSSSSDSSLEDLRTMDHTESFAAVVNYLGNHSVSEYSDLIREGSYQNRAAKWMAHGDPYSRRIPKVSPASKEGYSFMQRYIMTLMFYQMGGLRWKYDLNFLVAENTCDWYSWIVKPSSTTPMGVMCNDNNLIEGLIMVGADVSGFFPAEFGKLTTLRVIEMDVNEITGSIPQEFHKLEYLNNLHLSHNKLKGTLPSYLATFPELESIDVSFNSIEGVLPAELVDMTSLRGIAVDNNIMTGELPFAVGSGKTLDRLEYAFLEKNFFEGSVKDGMIDTLPALKVLDLSDNQFQGPIPPNVFKLSALQVLDLHDNSLTGNIPKGIPANTALLFLSLHKNRLTGKISEEIGNLQLLKHLDVSNNQLTGYESNAVTGFGLPSLTRLSYLFLAANPFPTGPVHDWIRNMTLLEELSLKSMNRDGTIPTWLGTDLRSLILLDLDNNELRGTIPTEFGQLNKLQFLLLNRNELTQEVPVEIGNLNSLRLLYLDGNGLVGDMDMLCEKSSATPGRFPLIVADCGGSDPAIECDCCRKCCEQGKDGCNDDQLVPSNDPMWQFSYDRVFYSFGNYTGYFFAPP